MQLGTISMSKDTSPLQNISPAVIKFRTNSNIYILKLQHEIVAIDAGDRAFRKDIELFLSKAVELDKVSKVFFTHLHYDHIGNFDLFRNAEFFASAQEIEDWKKNRVAAILNANIAEKFNVELKPFPHQIEGLKIIETPGHTKGSVCFWHEKEKLLFTGDTIFKKQLLGRTDFPTSAPEQMHASIMRLLDYHFKLMLPGHDY